MKRLLWCLAVVAALAVAGPITIDFEGQPVGLYPGGTVTITAGGIPVIFQGPGLRIRQFGAPFPNTRVLSSYLDAGPITVLFPVGLSAIYVEFENIVNGRYTLEVDKPIGTAYDIGNNILDMLQSSADWHHLDGPGIVKVVYVEGAQFEGFVIDNFRFEAIPEPATMWLAAVGVLVFLVRRRR